MRRILRQWLPALNGRLHRTLRRQGKHALARSRITCEQLESRLMLSGVTVRSTLQEGNASDNFGRAVAVDGNTMVIGADNADGGGAAYVYGRNTAGTSDQADDTWVLQKTLLASNREAGDGFGFSVAISGRTIVVGAYLEDSSVTGVNGNQADNMSADSGAAYVFADPNGDGNWSDAVQQAYLKASNTGASDRFGISVAISGRTIVVGACFEDSIATGINGNQSDNTAVDSGAAYVFVDPNGDGNWSDAVQQAYLKASNTGANDRFGISVAISGRTIVVGAHLEDSSATGVNGNQSDNSTADSGAAYVFADPNGDGSWSDAVQQAYLKASNTGGTDIFGFKVAVSGRTIVVGATGEGSSATGVNGNQVDNSANASGAAYVFADPNGDGNWSDAVQQAYLKASNTGGSDIFGDSVAVSGRTIVVGASGEDSSATGVNSFDNNALSSAGAAYAYVDPNGDGNWTDAVQQAYLKSAASPRLNDEFGFSVGVSGTTIVAGALSADSFDGTMVDIGAATVFYIPTAPAGLPTPILVTGAGAGGGPHVRVFEAQTGIEKFGLFAYGAAFSGGVNVATGDVDGDGVPDIITAPASAGGPEVKAFSGVDGHVLRDFMAYDPAFMGGVNISAADFNGDGKVDIVTGTGGGGGPHVKIFSGATGAELASYFAYDASFTGGVRVATGDINADGVPDLITGAGPGGGPHVKAFNGVTTTLLASFYAYQPTYTGGVFVASGNVDAAPGVGPDEIVVGEGTDGFRVKIFSAAGLVRREIDNVAIGVQHVATVDANGDGRADIVIGNGPGTQANVRTIDYATGAPISTLNPYGTFTGGVFVAGTGYGRKGSPLMATDGLVGARPGTSTLTSSELQPIVAAAQTRLRDAGISAAQLAAFSSVSVVISDLAGAQLGLALPGTIVIDVNAAGHGWFIDSTPLFDEEFHAIAGSQQLAANNALAAHRMDLLTVVMHELAHELGYEDIASDIASDNLMTESLPEGVRRLPSTLAMDAAFAEGP